MTISVGSGLAAQILAADETTYGVAASLTSPHSYEFKSETLELKKTTVVGEGLAAGHVYPRTRRRVLTNYDVNGAVNMEAPTRQLGFWLRYMIGDFTASTTPTQIGVSGIYSSVFQPRSTHFGHSFTLQKGVPTVDNATVEPFTYVGCKLSKWEISVSTGNIAQIVLTIDGRNELAGAGNNDPLNASVPALANWNLPVNGLGEQLWHFREATLFNTGTPTMAASSVSLTTPGVPATTVPVTNTTGQTAMVVITGGTVTTVLVNGTSAGTGDGTYAVPAGGNIAVTYSAA